MCYVYYSRSSHTPSHYSINTSHLSLIQSSLTTTIIYSSFFFFFLSPYLPHGLVDLLLVAVHLCEGPDLGKVNILPVTQGNDLVKRKDEVESIVQYILFIQSLTVLWDLEGGRERGRERRREGEKEGECKEEQKKVREREQLGRKSQCTAAESRKRFELEDTMLLFRNTPQNGTQTHTMYSTQHKQHKSLSETDHSREEPECLQVLQDVRGLGCHQQHVQPLQGLVDIADTLRLDEGVLFPRADELGEGAEQPLHSRSRHLYKLPRQQGCGVADIKSERARGR